MDQQTNNKGSSSTEGREMKNGDEVWIAKSKCKPVEPQAVDKVEYPEGANAIFVVTGHDRNGTVGTAKLDGKFWFFESLDKQFLSWCSPSEIKFLACQSEASDPVNPSHYKQFPAEVIDIIEAAIAKAPNNKAAGLHWQVLKYALRCWFKNGVEDLKKARWYLDRLIREEETK